MIFKNKTQQNAHRETSDSFPWASLLMKFFGQKWLSENFGLGFLFSTEKVLFGIFLPCKLTKAGHCNEIMEPWGVVRRHRISCFSILTSPCFQGMSGAVILGGVSLFPFLFQCSASSPDAQVVVFAPGLFIFTRWEVFSPGIFLLLPQVLGEFFSFSHSLSHDLKYDVLIKGVLESSSGLASSLSLSTKKKNSAPFVKELL